MTTNSDDALEMLSRFALEYQQKQKELESFLLDVEPHMVSEHLRIKMEITTNRFRLAQKDILTTIMSEDPTLEKDKLCRAVMGICRCFDEMRILFNALEHNTTKSLQT